MTKILYADTETFSGVPIKHGAYRYAESAEVMLVAFAWNDNPVSVWDTQDRPHWREELQEMVDYADTTCWHNSNFDRTVLRHNGVVIPTEKIEDTMITALSHSLPGKLEQLCEALRLPVDKAKDKDGKRLIQLFTKPRPKNTKIRRATRETHPDDWQRFIAYAARDVDAMRDVRRLLPAWNSTPAEHALWRHDQDVNDTGICGDIELADAAQRAFARTLRSLADDTARLTNGAVASLTQRDKFLGYLHSRGVELPDLTKATVSKWLERDLPADIRRLLEIRQQASATSPAKYATFKDAVSSDGRLRGTIQFCGAARTGRDAGRLVQLQNLPRSSLSYDAIEVGIEAMKSDCEHLIYENVSELCAGAVRGLLVAAPGKKFLVSDLSNIEGRMAAWLAGESWKLDAFKAFDAGLGPDLYVIAYARSFGVDPAIVLENKKTGDGSMRQIGKVQELSLQYQGGEGAFRKMAGALAETLSTEAIQDIVQAWRKAHPRIKSMWYDLEGAARAALREPGWEFVVRDVLRFDAVRDRAGVLWLRMRLPSGRYICYYRPEIEDGKLTYEGLNQYTRKWERIDTYGGKFFEQACQASSRDVFMAGFRRAMLNGLPVVLRVHDELVCEVPDDPAYAAERLASLMATNPGWAAGLPLAAEGFECRRYRK